MKNASKNMAISSRICYNNVTMQNIEYSEASELENAKMKTVMIELRYDGIVDVLKNLEGLFQKPRNIDEILQIWEAHISKNMRYDALNFSINKMFPP
jgi:hypothetical protein